MWINDKAKGTTIRIAVKALQIKFETEVKVEVFMINNLFFVRFEWGIWLTSLEILEAGYGIGEKLCQGCMSVLYQKRSVLTIDKTERIRRKLFKKIPWGVFEKFPWHFFEQSHNFAYWMQWGYARSEVRTWAHEIQAVLTRLLKNVFMRRFCFDALKIFFPCQELLVVGWIRLSRIHVLKWVNTLKFFILNQFLKTGLLSVVVASRIAIESDSE